MREGRAPEGGLTRRHPADDLVPEAGGARVVGAAAHEVLVGDGLELALFVAHDRCDGVGECGDYLERAQEILKK